jgi:hypothetical protein
LSLAREKTVYPLFWVIASNSEPSKQSVQPGF